MTARYDNMQQDQRRRDAEYRANRRRRAANRANRNRRNNDEMLAKLIMVIVLVIGLAWLVIQSYNDHKVFEQQSQEPMEYVVLEDGTKVTEGRYMTMQYAEEHPEQFGYGYAE